MELSIINVLAFIIVLIFLLAVLVWTFRKMVDFFDTLKFASKGCNRQGHPYVTDERMKEYYKLQPPDQDVEIQSTAHK